MLVATLQKACKSPMLAFASFLPAARRQTLFIFSVFCLVEAAGDPVV